jgi:iron complex outermembrane receptor protein
LPTYSIDMEMADRVDILKGPSQLINGISPRGSVGGGINVVPKRAGDKPLTEFTGSYASDSQVRAVDIGRRFGESTSSACVSTAVKQAGDTTWDHQSVNREMAVLGLDFRGERLRLSTDIGHTERDTDAPRSGCWSAQTPRCRMPRMCAATMPRPGARHAPRTPLAR